MLFCFVFVCFFLGGVFTVQDLPLSYIVYCAPTFTETSVSIQSQVLGKSWFASDDVLFSLSVHLSIERLKIQIVACPELGSHKPRVEPFPQLHHASYPEGPVCVTPFHVDGYGKSQWPISNIVTLRSSFLFRIGTSSAWNLKQTLHHPLRLHF